MDHYKHTKEDWEYPGFSYLNEALMSAIIDGDEAATITELAHQKRNETTDDISSHLIARGFWLCQKLRLIALHDSLAPTPNREEIASEIQACIRDLDEHFTQTFVSDNKENIYEKLSGDEPFREAVVSSNDVARYLIAIDQDSLKSPKDLLDHVALQHHMLIYDLERAPWEVNLGYWGGKTIVVDRLKSIIEAKIDAADRELIENIIGATSRSPL